MDTDDQAESEALPLLKLVPLARLELATHGLGIRCSIRTELQGYEILSFRYCAYLI